MLINLPNQALNLWSRIVFLFLFIFAFHNIDFIIDSKYNINQTLIYFTALNSKLQTYNQRKMNRKQSPQRQSNKQNIKNYKKTVQNYTISYCPKQFLGRSLYGQVRLGFQNNEKKVRAIRINSIPMSQQAKANLNLQKHYSQLSVCVRQIYEFIQSQSNRYTVMQYFPRTFKTELGYFRKLTKNMEPYIQRFLQTYSKLYCYRISHGNISLDNIGINFQGKVKLMDFRPLGHLTFEQASMKDYRDFRNMICFILEKDKKFPAKFQVFDDPAGDWDKLFSAWHVVNPYQYIYRQKKEPYQNIAVLLYKLESSIYPDDEQQKPPQNQNPCRISKEDMSSFLRIGLRFLILSSLKKVSVKSKKITQQINQLQRILSPLQKHNISFYNGLIWGAVNDPREYNFHQVQRLTLLMCLLPMVNHQYFFIQITKQFQPNKEQASKFHLFSQSLLHFYSDVMVQNLISL